MNNKASVKIATAALTGLLAVISLIAPAVTGAGGVGVQIPAPSAAALSIPSKEEITLLVTDSGLGGLSIMAETAARLKGAGIARKVHLVFVNALFSNESGYNSLRSRGEKSLVFSSALRGMERAVRPDAIVIGCNTLSVVYEETEFARTTRIPVERIIDPGVALFRRALERRPEAALVLFGTETTIGEGTHRQALAASGIPAARVHAKACPELAAYIENDWKGEEARFVIASYVDEALTALPQPKPPVYAGLVCTHYGYSRELWEAAFKENGVRLLEILNPNSALTDRLMQVMPAGRFKETAIDAQVISMVEIAAAKRKALGNWLGGISPEVAAALANYQLRPDLFEWKSLVTPR